MTIASSTYDPHLGWAPGTEPFDTYRFDKGGIVFDEPDTPDALWGSGAEVLAARGEPTILYSATGIGKTTLAQRVALAAIGIGDPTLLGYPVSPIRGRVLYIAADRPRQALRSLRRMVTDGDRQILEERWRWERRHRLRILVIGNRPLASVFPLRRSVSPVDARNPCLGTTDTAPTRTTRLWGLHAVNIRGSRERPRARRRDTARLHVGDDGFDLRNHCVDSVGDRRGQRDRLVCVDRE